MKLAAFMDPLYRILPYKDTTIAFLQAGQELGWSCKYFTPIDLFCESGEVYAITRDITIGDIHSDQWVQEHGTQQQNLNEFDIILVRKDPPFNMEYIYATYALELAERQGVLVVNKPQSLRDANEKMFILNFPQCCPPTLVSRDITKLHTFWERHKNIIFKPLASMGGNSIFYVDAKGENLSVILELLTQNQTNSIMAQRYIPEIKTAGDKRIILINGEPISYGLARIPKQGEIRGNLFAGARGRVVDLNARDRWICEQIAPTLQAKGLSFVGIDVIGDYLTEINVTSPTCVREIGQETGIDIAQIYLQTLAKMR